MKPIKAADCIASLNTLKQAMLWRGKYVFGKEDFMDIWKRAGLPSSTLIWKYILEVNIVEKVEWGKYRFPNEDPIYVGHVETVLAKYRNKASKKESKTQQLVLTEDKCIKYLRNMGYVVYLPKEGEKVVVMKDLR